MLDFEKVKSIANAELQEIQKKCAMKLVFVDEATFEFKFGWIFYYQSERYVLYGNFGDRLGGNSPIMVDKYSGEVIPTGTGRPISEYIKEYGKKRGSWPK